MFKDKLVKSTLSFISVAICILIVVTGCMENKEITEQVSTESTVVTEVKDIKGIVNGLKEINYSTTHIDVTSSSSLSMKIDNEDVTKDSNASATIDYYIKESLYEKINELHDNKEFLYEDKSDNEDSSISVSNLNAENEMYINASCEVSGDNSFFGFDYINSFLNKDLIYYCDGKNLYTETDDGFFQEDISDKIYAQYLVWNKNISSFYNLISTYGTLGSDVRMGEIDCYKIDIKVSEKNLYPYVSTYFTDEQSTIFGSTSYLESIIDKMSLSGEVYIAKTTNKIIRVDIDIVSDDLTDLFKEVNEVDNMSDVYYTSKFSFIFSYNEEKPVVPQTVIQNTTESSYTEDNREEKISISKMDLDNYLVDISVLGDVDYDSIAFTSWYKAYETDKSRETNSDFYNGCVDIDKLDSCLYDKKTALTEGENYVEEYELLGEFEYKNYTWEVYQAFSLNDHKQVRMLFFTNDGFYSISVANEHDESYSLEKAQSWFESTF